MALVETARLPKTFEEKETQRRLIVVLEECFIESANVGKGYQLLNHDDHSHFLMKHKRDPNEARPDIVHQCLLTLLDSPLNKAGMLQVYIHTKKHVLIEVNPQTRIPRTFKRFCGLMVQLLHKLSIRATNGPEKLLRVIKNPVTQYFPISCRKFGTSHKATELVDIQEFVGKLPKGEPVVFVVGGLAHGKVEADYVEKELSISNFPLSASVVCGKICCAFEQHWGVL